MYHSDYVKSKPTSDVYSLEGQRCHRTDKFIHENRFSWKGEADTVRDFSLSISTFVEGLSEVIFQM